jgi:hypothetical protein
MPNLKEVAIPWEEIVVIMLQNGSKSVNSTLNLRIWTVNELQRDFAQSGDLSQRRNVKNRHHHIPSYLLSPGVTATIAEIEQYYRLTLGKTQPNPYFLNDPARLPELVERMRQDLAASEALAKPAAR